MSKEEAIAMFNAANKIVEDPNRDKLVLGMKDLGEKVAISLGDGSVRIVDKSNVKPDALKRYGIKGL